MGIPEENVAIFLREMARAQPQNFPRPNHAFVSLPHDRYLTPDVGCSLCRPSSPFRFDRGGHPITVEEDPF